MKCKNCGFDNDALTKTEMENLKLLCEGLSCKDVSVRLGVSTKTHRSNIYRKLNIPNANIVKVFRWAIEHGFIEITLTVKQKEKV
jgi:DNA-binding NarL/FixJ family response regulator